MGNASVNWQALIYSELLTKGLVSIRHLVQEVGWILITNTCNEFPSEKAVFQKGPSLRISSAARGIVTASWPRGCGSDL